MSTCQFLTYSNIYWSRLLESSSCFRVIFDKSMPCSLQGVLLRLYQTPDTSNAGWHTKALLEFAQSHTRRSIDFHWFPLIHQKNFPIKQASSSGIPGPIFRPLRMCVPTGHANKSCNRPPVWTFDGWTKKCFIICQLDICPLFVGSQTLIELIARKPSTTQVVSPSHYPQGRQRLARHRRSKRKTRHDMGHFSRGCYERLPN